MQSAKMLLLPAIAAALLGGCASASGGKSAAESSPGKFVTYSCEDNQSFQARFNAEAGTVRVRSKDGGVELSRSARGLYRDSEQNASSNWILTLRDGKESELVFEGKAKYKNCAAA